MKALYSPLRIALACCLLFCTFSARSQVQGLGGLDSLTLGERTSPVHFLALGNAHYERGAFGEAILAYERGLRLQPGEKRLVNNLRFVRGEAGIDRPQIEPFLPIRIWRSLGALLGVGLARWLALLFWALAVAGAVVWYLYRERMAETRRFALLPTSGLLLVLALLFYALAGSRLAYLENDRDAILVGANVELCVAPGPDATLEERLSAGLKLRILDEFESYVKVSLENGRQGWVPVGAVARI